MLVAFTMMPALQEAPVQNASAPATVAALENLTNTSIENSADAPFQIAIPTWRLGCSLNQHQWGCTTQIDPITGLPYCECAVGVGNGGG